MLIARQSTARTVTVGPVLDADGVAVTGGVVGDFKIAKNGGAPAALNGSATLTHRHTGFYSLALTASDLDTVGQAEVVIDDTVNACPVKEITVIEEAVYDISFAASATGAVPVASIAANAITATSIATDAITDAKVASDVTIASVTGAVGSVTGAVGSVTGAVGSIASGGITAASFAANAITAAKLDPDVTTELQAGLATAAALATVDGIVDDILADTADMQPKLGTPAGASISADIAAIEAQTDDIGTAGAGLTAVPWNAAWDAEVQSEVQDAIEANHLDHLLAVTYDPASKPGAADALLNELVESDGGVARYTANALEQAPTGGSAPTAADIADAVWEEALTDHSGTAGSTAEALGAAGSAGDPWATALPGAYSSGQAGKIIGDNLNATVGSRATQTSVDDIPTNAELATALASADDAVLAAIAALNNLSQANIRTAVGLGSANLDTQLGDLPTNAELATALAAADDAVLAAIAALNNLSIANVRTAVGLASANLDTQLDALPTNAELATALAAADDAVLAAIAALNNLSAAQVNAEVLDVLATDTFAEPASVPAATASLKDKINFLAALARNRVTQTATTQTLRNAANSADIGTAAVSDDGTTFVRAGWS